MGLPCSNHRSLLFEGLTFEVYQQSHVKIQAIDCDGDGEVEIIISTEKDQWRGRVFTVMKDRLGLSYTGAMLEHFHLDDWIMDIDDDGELECVYSADEQGVGYYYRMKTP